MILYIHLFTIQFFFLLYSFRSFCVYFLIANIFRHREKNIVNFTFFSFLVFVLRLLCAMYVRARASVTVCVFPKLNPLCKLRILLQYTNCSGILFTLEWNTLFQPYTLITYSYNCIPSTVHTMCAMYMCLYSFASTHTAYDTPIIITHCPTPSSSVYLLWHFRFHSVCYCFMLALFIWLTHFSSTLTNSPLTHLCAKWKAPELNKIIFVIIVSKTLSIL